MTINYTIMISQHSVAIWKPQYVQKPMGPKTFITLDAKTVPNFLAQ